MGAITRIVLFDPRLDHHETWPSGVGPRDARAELCREAGDALRVLLSIDGRAALVAWLGDDDEETLPVAVLLMHAARYREPPASVVVLTRHPDRARAILIAEGVTAEVLHPPTSIAELLLRLS